MSRAVDLLPARSTAATGTRQGEKTPGGYCTADSFCRQLSFTSIRQLRKKSLNFHSKWTIFERKYL